MLSGNRNFEGRVHPLTKANYLCSPPLVVAYALAGTVDIDLTSEPLGKDRSGKPVFLKDLWPSEDEIAALVKNAAAPDLYRTLYKNIAESNPAWTAIRGGGNPVYEWEADSTYIREPPFVSDVPASPRPSRTFSRRASSACSATSSRPTTFRPPARSRRTARPAST